MVRDARQKKLRGLAQSMRRRRKLLFSAGSPMNVVVLRPLLDVLGLDERIDLYFAGEYRQADDTEQLARSCGLSDVTLLSEQEAKRLKADLYLCPDGSRYGKLCHCRVLLFHGVSFKGRSLSERARWFHQVFLVGPYQRKQFAKRGIFEEHDPRLVSIGMPKLDRLARGEIDRAQVRERLRVPPGSRCVLYAPTWSDQSSLFTLGEELISALAAEPDLHLLIKLHDHHLNPRRSSVDWAARATDWNSEKVTLVEDLDVTPALAAADLLITDASSVSQEFCLLDRPILFARVPELYGHERYLESADQETWGQRAGLSFQTVPEALLALRRSFDHPEELSPIRGEIARDLFYHPGQATEHALEVLYRQLRLSR